MEGGVIYTGTHLIYAEATDISTGGIPSFANGKIEATPAPDI